jgi:hypothetical protein
MAVTFVGQSPYVIPNEAVSVNVDSSGTVSSGGAQDWHGRATIKRLGDDNLVLVYRTGTSHMSATSALQIRFSDDNGATWTGAGTTLSAGTVSGFPMVPSTGNINAGDGWLYVAPSGRLILHLWRVDGAGDWPEDPKGTEQSVSTDNGATWSTPVAVDFTGISDEEHTFSTDDDFVYGGVIYAATRTYDADTPTDSYVSFIKSTDDGATWTWVSDITTAGSDTQEVGLEYTGNNRIVAMVRSLNNDETLQADSDDFGLTWTLTDVSSTVQVSGRHRIYTRAHLKGEDNWWNDPVLVMVGFELMTPGSSQGRRNAVWVSRDRGATWSGPHYLDIEVEDAGYGDIFYDADNDQWVVVTYQGTLLAASLMQYRLTIDGI